MLEMTGLPQLAVGSHADGGGRACIMNALAYLEGAADITDMPACVWPPLAWLSQVVNDNICDPGHVGWQLGSKPADECVWINLPAVDDGCPDSYTCTSSACMCVEQFELLCPTCSHTMWMLGSRLIGTGRVPVEGADLRRIMYGMIRISLEALADRGACEMVVQAFRGVLDGDVTLEDVDALLQRCDFEHDHVNCQDFRNNLDMMLNYWAVAESGEVAHEKLLDMYTSVARQGLVDDPDRAVVFGRMIDLFEAETGFLAIPPTRQEIDKAAQRAGLVSV